MQLNRPAAIKLWYGGKVKFIILGISLLFLLSGCDHSAPQAIRFGLATAPINLDPRFATDATSARINRLVYRALVDFDEQFQPIPELATWELLTPTHYRFHLGDRGRRFHDGSPLTAEDVKATYDFILVPENASPHRGALSLIEKIEVLDADTVDFFLEKADPLLPGRLTIGILPAAAIQRQHPFNQKPLGSGPFKLLKWPQSGQLWLQRRRDRYIFEFLEIKDPVVRVLKLVRGEIHLLQDNLSPELIAWLSQRPHIRIQQRAGTNFSYLGFNLQDPVTGQLVVRQAIAHAIDRQAIIQYILGGGAQLAKSFLLPPNHWASHAEVKQQYDYDPTQAQALLAQAGYQQQPLELTYKTSSSQPLRIRIASVIQQQLAAVGIKMNLRTYDWGTLYGDIKAGRFQLYSLSWVGIKMPNIFRYVFHSQSVPPQGANRGRFLNTTADQLIEQAEQAPTLTAQAHYYRQLQTLLWQQLPYIPLWFEDQILATTDLIKGYTLAADGNYDGLKTVTLMDIPDKL